eukprot:g4391.t1
MSLSNYGHNRDGVNIQNLKSLSVSATQVLPGGYRTENDWKREARETIAEAENEKILSKSLRDASRRLEEDLKVKVETEQTVVDNALKCRITKTTEIKDLIEKAIENTDVESKNLEVSRCKLRDRANNVRKKLSLNDGRVKIRCQKPTRELVNDVLQLQLQRQGGMLKNYLNAIENRIKVTDNNIQRLAYMKQKLNKDLAAKAMAIEVDQKALEADSSTSAHCEDIFSSPTAVQPHQWSKQTEDTIKSVNSLARETERFRQDSQNMLKDNEYQRKTTTDVLNKAMLEKLNQTESLKNQLQLKLDEIAKEIEAAKHRRQSLEESLEEKRVPLERANQRLAFRQQRPSHERVNDEAHRALVAELRHLTVVTSALRSKISAVNCEIRHLETQRDRLQDNIKDKQRSWKVMSIYCHFLIKPLRWMKNASY